MKEARSSSQLWTTQCSTDSDGGNHEDDEYGSGEDETVETESLPLSHSGVFLSSRCFVRVERRSDVQREEPEMPRDMREEYQRVLGDLRLNTFRSLSFDTRMKLAIVKRKIALLLTGIVGMERRCECRSVRVKTDCCRFQTSR